MNKIGIYMINNVCNNRIYIGQSINITSRIANHKYALRKGIHTNDYLQKQFDKYQEECFEFIILEECPIEELDHKEIKWIKHFKSLDRAKGYNLEAGGNKGKIISEEVISARRGKGNPMFGKKHSPEFVDFIRAKNRGLSDKLDESDVSNIKEALIQGITQRNLAEKFDVKISTINKIAKCKNWTWVREDLNENLISFQGDKKNDRDKNIFELWKENIPMYKIAKELNCDRGTVKKVLEKNNIIPS